MRLYHYVGPKRIADRAGPEPTGTPILCAADVRFRRCVGCGGLNLVEERVFECGVCGVGLPAAYNVQG